MDEVEVEVVETPLGHLTLGHGHGMLAAVVVVPELRGDEEILALDEAVLDGPVDALARLGAVAVVVGAVDMAVAHLDGVVDGVGRGLAGDLPDTEADNGHALKEARGGACVSLVNTICSCCVYWLFDLEG